MKKLNYEIIVGLIIVLAVAIIILGNTIFTEHKHKNDYYNINVTFTQVGGLETGSNVYVNGVRAGEVNSIRLIKKYVEVIISLSKDVPLYKSSQIYVQENGLMGERNIFITQGDSNKILNNYDDLRGFYLAGIHETVTDLNYVIKDLQNIFNTFSANDLNTIRDNMTKLDLLLTNVNLLFEKDGKIPYILDKTDDAISSVDSLIDNNSPKIQTLINETNQQISSLDILLNNLNMLTVQLQNPNSDFGKLTTQDTLYNKLNKTVTNLDSLIKDVKKNPGKYFSIF